MISPDTHAQQAESGGSGVLGQPGIDGKTWTGGGVKEGSGGGRGCKAHIRCDIVKCTHATV